MEQIYGNFPANHNILENQLQCTHLGIQADPGVIVFINNNAIQIGETGLLELFEMMDIDSLKFNKDVQNVIIEYT